MPDALVVTLVRGGAGGGSKEKDGQELGEERSGNLEYVVKRFSLSVGLDGVHFLFCFAVELSSKVDKNPARLPHFLKVVCSAYLQKYICLSYLHGCSCWLFVQCRFTDASPASTQTPFIPRTNKNKMGNDTSLRPTAQKNDPLLPR